jgi:hypothetical protein
LRDEREEREEREERRKNRKRRRRMGRRERKRGRRGEQRRREGGGIIFVGNASECWLRQAAPRPITPSGYF